MDPATVFFRFLSFQSFFSFLPNVLLLIFRRLGFSGVGVEKRCEFPFALTAGPAAAVRDLRGREFPRESETKKKESLKDRHTGVSVCVCSRGPNHTTTWPPTPESWRNSVLVLAVKRHHAERVVLVGECCSTRPGLCNLGGRS